MNEKLVVFVVIAISVCLAVGILGYQQGLAVNDDSEQTVDRYDEGLSVGDSQGYSRGLSDGVGQGYAQGYQAGYVNGTANAPKPSQAPDRYSEGYDAGVSSGKNQGYSDGYSKGTTDGFNNGYSVGYVNGTRDGAGTGYNIRDPTYSEMLNFIAVDQTDKNTYNENTYYCYHFCNDVLTNAFSQGLKAGFVYIEFAEGAHAVVCFDTVDKGLVFIEPQGDDVVNVAVGVDYELVAEPNTIISFSIVW